MEYFFHVDPRELEIIYSANEKLNAPMMVCFAEKGTSFHLKRRQKGSALNVTLLKRMNIYSRLQNPCPANHHH